MTAKMKRCRSRQQKPRKKPTTPRKSGNRGTIANTCQHSPIFVKSAANDTVCIVREWRERVDTRRTGLVSDRTVGAEALLLAQLRYFARIVRRGLIDPVEPVAPQQVGVGAPGEQRFEPSDRRAGNSFRGTARWSCPSSYPSRIPRRACTCRIPNGRARTLRRSHAWR